MAAKADDEGYDLIERLISDWIDGSNRFDRPGEVLFEGRLATRLVAIGGLNVDPYTDDPSVGRVRHVYVAPEARGQGLGTELIERIISHARRGFARLRLRAGVSGVGPFYERLGFVPTDEPDATHTLSLRDMAY